MTCALAQYNLVQFVNNDLAVFFKLHCEIINSFVQKSPPNKHNSHTDGLLRPNLTLRAFRPSTASASQANQLARVLYHQSLNALRQIQGLDMSSGQVRPGGGGVSGPAG